MFFFFFGGGFPSCTEVGWIFELCSDGLSRGLEGMRLSLPLRLFGGWRAGSWDWMAWMGRWLI